MNTISETILLGRGRQILEIPRSTWEGHLAAAPQHTQARFKFMTPDHHRVRYFVVSELAQQGEPIEPGTISQELHLTADHTASILDDLEHNLFFLVRNAAGAVSWAYPVTVEPTPHRLSFSTGERLYAA
jgi:hypothetical protein